MKVLHIALAVLMALALSACAEYSIKSNKSNLTGKLENIYVWSAIGSIEPFTEKRLFSDETFENMFNAAFTKGLSEIGVRNKLRRYSPGTDTETDLARFEGETKPEYRLFIVSPKYTTLTAKGITNVDVLYLNVIISRTKDNQRVWQSEIVINTNTAPGNAWREPGAKKLADMVINALKQDGLL